MTNKRKRLGVAYCLCLIIFAFLGLALRYINYQIAYKHGWSLTGNNLMGEQMVLTLLYLAACLVAFFIAFIVLIYRLIKKQRLWFMECLFMLCIVLVGYISEEMNTSFHVPFEKGFCDRILQEVDADQMRSLTPLIRSQTESVLPEKQWPAHIKKLTPNKYVKIEKDQDGIDFLRLTWGSPYGHFGIVVGPEDWTISEDQLDEFNQIENGLYFWREK